MADPARQSALTKREPRAAQFHFIPRAIKPLQDLLVRLLRSYVERAPGWVLLTTIGRKTGIAREVLLPCERTGEFLIVISTYGRRSDWIRNIQREPRVTVTCAGWRLAGRAEIVDDLERKRAILTAHPFFPPAPVAPFHLVLRTILRPVLVLLLRRWVTVRPIVLVYPEALVRDR